MGGKKNKQIKNFYNDDSETFATKQYYTHQQQNPTHLILKPIDKFLTINNIMQMIYTYLPLPDILTERNNNAIHLIIYLYLKTCNIVKKYTINDIPFNDMRNKYLTNWLIYVILQTPCRYNITIGVNNHCNFNNVKQIFIRAPMCYINLIKTHVFSAIKDIVKDYNQNVISYTYHQRLINKPPGLCLSDDENNTDDENNNE